MVQLHHDYEKFEAKDTKIVAIGPDNSGEFQEFWEKNNIQFYGIPDTDHTVSNLYGQEVNLLKLGRMPAQMIVDKQGILRYVHYGKSMKDIAENDEILKFIDEL